MKEVPFAISAGVWFFEEHDKLKTKFIWRIKIFMSIFKIKANEGRHAQNLGGIDQREKRHKWRIEHSEAD